MKTHDLMVTDPGLSTTSPLSTGTYQPGTGSQDRGSVIFSLHPNQVQAVTKLTKYVASKMSIKAKCSLTTNLFKGPPNS